VSIWLVIRNQPWSKGSKSQTTVAIRADSIGSGVMDNLLPQSSARDVFAADKTSEEEAEKPSFAKGKDSDRKGVIPFPENAESTKAKTGHAGQAVTSPSSKPPETARSEKSTPKLDVYLQAEPLEGYTHLYAYFNENLLYPPQAVKDSVEGIETVSFTIDQQGMPTLITITQSLGPLFDQEAIRLIRQMPAWKPATLNGHPVASQLSVPLTFELKRIIKP
jgi:TonB family protein